MQGFYTTIGSLAIGAVCLCVYAQAEDSQYLVYLASDDPFVIQQVKTIAPDAFTGTLDSGRKVLQLGRYTNLNLAQKRSDELKALGLPIEIAKVSNKAPIAAQNDSGIPAPSGFNPPPSTVVSTIPIQTVPSNDPMPLPGVPGNWEPAPANTIDIQRAPTSTLPSPNLTTNTNAGSELQAFAQRNRYFVIIPTISPEVLAQVRQITPTAKLSATERGAFIEIQGYPDRGSAENLNRDFRNRGFDSRVIFF